MLQENFTFSQISTIFMMKNNISFTSKVFANFRKNKSILSLTINLSKKGMLIFNISCLSKTISK